MNGYGATSFVGEKTLFMKTRLIAQSLHPASRYEGTLDARDSAKAVSGNIKMVANQWRPGQVIPVD